MKARLIDVAKLANVSRTTAFRVLSGEGNVKEDTYQRVMKAAEQLNYRPNRYARALRTKSSKVIGVVFSNLFSGHFYADIFKGIEDAAYAEGYTLILGSADENLVKEQKLLNTLVEHQVDGVIVAPMDKKGRKSFETFKKENTPIVFVDKYIEGFPADRVVTDNWLGGKLVAEYLWSLGHKDIAFCKGVGWNNTSTYFREQGFVSCLKKQGVNSLEGITFPRSLDNAMEYGYQAVKKRLEQGSVSFTAIFCFTDNIAAGCVYALLKAGFRIPEDISVVGYNDDDFCKYHPIGLTTVAQPKYEMGKKAAELLLARCQGKGDAKYREITLRPKLVLRESCSVSPSAKM